MLSPGDSSPKSYVSLANSRKQTAINICTWGSLVNYAVTPNLLKELYERNFLEKYQFDLQLHKLLEELNNSTDITAAQKGCE